MIKRFVHTLFRAQKYKPYALFSQEKNTTNEQKAEKIKNE